MPGTAINYDNTMFYKICCKDPAITENYVGHTTNWNKRKQLHKESCNNVNIKQHNYPVYKFIRENGGWNNWDMILIDRCSCVDELEAKQK